MHTRFTALDVFVFVSHLSIALMASVAVEALAELEWWVRLVMIVAYLGGSYWLFRVIMGWRGQREATERDKWHRYQLLQSGMLGIMSQFLKDRYRVNHELAAALESAVGSQQPLTPRRVAAIFEDFDKERRTHIQTALARIPSFLVDDAYLKPTDPDTAVQDQFKVSYYAVERGADGEQCLRKKWRYYPNDGEPRTTRFVRGEGASGLAWETKRIVICEKGGEDRKFKPMWEGQKDAYASMLCVPAIEDIPADKISEVHGILTVDTPQRQGYFQSKLEQFWADLFQPICNLLIYCEEVERIKEAVAKAATRMETRATSGT